MKKNKTTYRLDSTFNNERLHIDVRDDISLMMALSADKNLELDSYTMIYIISLRRSLLLTSENTEEETIKITSRSLYKLKKKILAEEKKQAKKVKIGQASEAKPLGIVEQDLNMPEEESKEEMQDLEDEEELAEKSHKTNN